MALTDAERTAILKGSKEISVDGLKKVAHDPASLLELDDKERIRATRSSCSVPQILRQGMFRITPTR